MIRELYLSTAAATCPPKWEELCLRYAQKLRPGGELYDPSLLKALGEMEQTRSIGRECFTLMAGLITGREWQEDPERDRNLVFLQRAASLARSNKKYATAIAKNRDAINPNAIKTLQSATLYGFIARTGMEGVSKPEISPLLTPLSSILRMRVKTNRGVDIEQQAYQDIHERYSRFKGRPEAERDEAVKLFASIHATLQDLYPACMA